MFYTLIEHAVSTIDSARYIRTLLYYNVFPVTGLGTSSPRHVFHTSSEWHSTCLHCNCFSAGGNDGIRLTQKEGQKTRSSTVVGKESCKIGQLLISVCLVVTNTHLQTIHNANRIYVYYTHLIDIHFSLLPTFHIQAFTNDIPIAKRSENTPRSLRLRLTQALSCNFNPGSPWLHQSPSHKVNFDSHQNFLQLCVSLVSSTVW